VQINHLFQMILYVQQNEETSCLKLVHFFDRLEAIPSEMEANAKCELPPLEGCALIQTCTRSTVLDEAFPEITIDLVSSFSA
jgi:hypothetical protein